MKRQQAFVGQNKLLKGQLHCHTTRSDGKVEPEEAIRFYAQNGYDFLALTDHRRYNHETFAPDVPITIIPGMEFDNIFEKGEGSARRCFHTVCLGPSVADGNGFVHDERMESGTAANQEEFQKYLDEFHAANNLTIYCHPEWSCTPPRYFEKMQGNFAVELWNTGNVINRDMDRDNGLWWDELLGQGRKIYGVAVDDGHRIYHFGHSRVMVRADNNVASILTALKAGAFYSSCGPQIYDFYVDDDGKAVVECSPAKTIRLYSDMHFTLVARETEEPLVRAEWQLRGGNRYVRAVVIDKEGRYAWTNPIFFDERREAAE